MERLADKTILITGAAGGMGQCHAIMMAAQGANIIAVDIDGEASRAGLEETRVAVEKRDGDILVHTADVRRLDELDRALEAGVRRFGGLDCVVANAAVTHFSPAFDHDEESWSRILETNLRGSWATCKAASPYLARGASIVLIGSTSALRPAPGFIAYSASKHGLIGLMRTMMVELAPRGIRVNAVHPGLVDTPMLHNPSMYAILTGDPGASREAVFEALKGSSPLGVPWVDPADVSHAVIYLCSDDARYVNGANIAIDAGVSAT